MLLANRSTPLLQRQSTLRQQNNLCLRFPKALLRNVHQHHVNPILRKVTLVTLLSLKVTMRSIVLRPLCSLLELRLVSGRVLPTATVTVVVLRVLLQNARVTASRENQEKCRPNPSLSL